MFIESFEIALYRSCLKTKFPLEPDLTGLIGVNASGKSNVLNAITLLRKATGTEPPMRREEPSFGNTCRISLALRHMDRTLYVRGNIVYETDERNRDEVYDSQFRFNFRFCRPVNFFKGLQHFHHFLIVTFIL